MPLPDTLTGEPTVVPPEQSVGAEACGPNTLNVTVPDGEAPPDNVADTDDAEIADPAVPDDGATTPSPGVWVIGTVFGDPVEVVAHEDWPQPGPSPDAVARSLTDP